MNHLLTKFHQQRFDWAFEARDDFLSRFQVFETENKKVDSKKLTISVYGPTQVGKSTLILTLLGVKEQFLPVISKFLRGKRHTGESSTVTVTIYRISSNDQYQIKLPNSLAVTVETEQQLEEQLARLRENIEEGIINSIDPVIIAIPRSMFENPDEQLEIIDLPGTESAELKEVHHVRRCVQYWIPNSHVCLIVNAANDLTFLRDVDMPQLSQWYEYENNYFFVLTRAFTPTSVKKEIVNGTIETEEALVQYYKEYIYEILYHKKGTIYPIEIGDSLKKLGDVERQLAQTMIESLKQRLAEIDVQKISFNYLSSYYREVLKQGESEVQFLDKEIELQRQHIEDLNVNFKALSEAVSKQLEANETKLNDITAKNAEIHHTFSQAFQYEQLARDITSRVKKSSEAKKASVLNHLFTGLIFETEEKFNEALKKSNALYKDVAMQFKTLKTNELQLPEALELEFVLWDKSRIDTYLSTGNYLSQKNRMLHHFLEIVKNHINHIKLAKRKIDKLVDLLVKEIEMQIRDNRIVLNVDREKMSETIQTEETKLKKLCEEYVKTQNLWESDKAHAMKYREYFINHFIGRKNELLKMSISPNVEDKYLASLFLRTLGQDAQKIIESMRVKNKDES